MLQLPNENGMNNKLREPRQGIKVRLHTKLLASMFVLECLLIVGIIVVVGHQMRQSILEEFLKRGLHIARNLAAINTNYIASYNYVSIAQNVERVVEENGLLYATVLFYDGEMAAYRGRAAIKDNILAGSLHHKALEARKILIQQGELANEEFYDFAVPIFLEGAKWGTVRAGLSLNSTKKAFLRTRNVLLGLGILGLACGWLFSFLFIHHIMRPIGCLVKSVEPISNGGEYEHPIEIVTHDEIGYLGSQFAAMQERIKDHIQRNLELTAANKTLLGEIADRKRT
jgi:sensor histidine kinase regulating citrate/malate metabolism